MIEQFMEILWWALAAGAPFLVGNMGGSQPKPPTLDTAQSQKLTRGDYELKEEFTPRLTETTGKSGREEYARNISFALRGFTDPSSIYQGEIEDLRQGRTKTQKQLDALTGARQSSGRYGKTYRVDGKWLGEQDYQKRVSELQSRVDRSTNQITKLRKSDPVKDLQKAFRPEFRQRDRLLGQMSGAQRTTDDFRQYQRELRTGLGAGQLGNQLMAEALERSKNPGMLTAQAERDAVQAARSGMASRGMATGAAGLGAELLNRDAYQRSRAQQDLAFAQDVQGQDINRRQANIGFQGQAAANADAERARKLGLGQDMYNFRLSTNPKLMLAGLGSPYSNFTPQALELMNNTNVAPIYSGGQLGSPGAFQTIMGTAGQFAQAGGQAYAASASDRRMKKDIKQTGKDGLLGLKTYEYRFKGESKDSPKHRGFMAQEVQKVLPEAVEEFDYKGKKRLAIKPAVIGQAMAQMLAEQQKNMFADGYVVGAGAGA